MNTQRRKKKTATFFKKLGWWVSAHALKASSFIVGKLPGCFIPKVAEGLGMLSFYVVPRLRKVGMENARKVFGSDTPKHKAQALIKANLKNISHNMLEIARCRFSVPPQRYLEKTISVKGQEHLENALKKGKGVLAISAHLGNFPLIGARMATLGYSFRIIYKEPENICLKDFFSRWMHSLGMGIVPYKPRRVCVNESLKILRQNGIVFLQIDQNPTMKHGVYVEFFGHDLLTYSGPVVLAMRSGAAIVPMFIHRNADHTESIEILPELKFRQSKMDDQELTENLRMINAVCEEWIRKYPEQWWWIHRRFRRVRQEGKSRSVYVRAPGLLSGISRGPCTDRYLIFMGSCCVKLARFGSHIRAATPP